MIRTTVGQLLVNQALPEDMRDHARVLDKKGMNALLRELAEKHPDKYVEVSKKLSDVGRTVATEFGGYTFGLEHLRTSAVAKKIRAEIQQKMRRILGTDQVEINGRLVDVTPQMRKDMIVKMVGSYQQRQIDEIYAEAKKANNPLALQVVSGSRGNQMNLASLIGSDLLYSDHRDEVIPLPVLSSYSQGLKPMEYWAATYGARRGTMATKFATQDAGFLSKQLNQVAHRLMVVDEEDPRDVPNRGLPVDTDDGDNEGALLAQDVGPYKRNTVLSPKILKHLKGLGHDRILVRSPLVGGSPDGGIYARDVGVRERGTLPGRGEQVGLTAAQALSEPLSQGQLSAKHSGGVAGQEKAVGGFAYINQLIQVPQKFKGGAAHAEHDGTVSSIEPAPAGGHYVWVNDKRHYVPAGVALKVGKGDAVEAGDVISEGFPNPAIVTEHKGVGEGKRYFVNAMRQAMNDAGMKVNRRNVEVLARGLINHVVLTDEMGDNVPDDVLPYSTVENVYQPRTDSRSVRVGPDAAGKYLESPVLHYSVGTKVRPSVLKELQHFGVGEVTVHSDPPPFKPRMIRGMYSLQNDPDWMTRMYGSGLKSSVLDATHHGAVSDELGTSFVPGLARAVDFGRVGTVRAPEPGTKPPPEGQPFGDPRRTTPATPAKTTLEIPEPAKPEPKRTGFFSGLFKTSEEEIVKEAAVRLARPVDQIRTALAVRPVRPTRMVKVAEQPRVDSTVRPNTGSSTAAPATRTVLPAGGGAATASPPSTPRGIGAMPVMSAAPSGVPQPPAPPVPQGPSPAGPPAPAGFIHPARLGGFNPGFAPSAGMFNPSDDPDTAAAFVAGGGDPNQPGSGFGGEFGSVARFGSLLDTQAVAALTGGSSYVPGQYAGGYSDDLIGGDRNAGPVGSPIAAAPAPPQTGTNAVQRLMTNPYTSQLAFRLFGAGFKKLPAVGWAVDALDAANAPAAEIRNEMHNPTWQTYLSPSRAIRGSGMLLGEARQMNADVAASEQSSDARRVAEMEIEAGHLSRSGTTRQLSSQETERLNQLRSEISRIRAARSTNAMSWDSDRVTTQKFNDQVRRSGVGAAVGDAVRRLRGGEQAATGVFAGTASPADREMFDSWLDHTTGSGRTGGAPASTGQLTLREMQDHRARVDAYVQRMNSLAASASAGNRRDVAERANQAIAATRKELADWDARSQEDALRRSLGQASPQAANPSLMEQIALPQTANPTLGGIRYNPFGPPPGPMSSPFLPSRPGPEINPNNF